MTNRRHFITLVPFAGVALLAACSKEAATTDTAPATAPMPAPAPAMPTPATEPSPSATGTDPAAVSGAEPRLLEETDPVAAGLGYVADASRADSAKYKNYTAGQNCGNCSLFGGTASDTRGPCPLFTGKDVLAAGWCSAYVKKSA